MSTARKEKPATKAKVNPGHRVFAYPFAKIYLLWLQKVERKSRTKQELDQVLRWLTGYTAAGLQKQVRGNDDLESFFAKAPKFNPAAKLITGKVCGVRVEEVPDPVMRKIRQADKLIDELAQGRAMEKILRRDT
jgi:hypothetical protein